jgi:hypothetical protein
MSDGPDFSKVTAAADYIGEDETDHALIQEMLETARRFLEDFRWCRRVRETFVGQAIGGVVGVFLFRIEPAGQGIDEWLWVIVGDLPPAYLVTDDSRTPAEALKTYIELVEEWVEAVQHGRPVDKLIPVATADGRDLVEETPENARMLKSRLESLEEDIVPEFERVERVDA